MMLQAQPIGRSPSLLLKPIVVGVFAALFCLSSGGTSVTHFSSKFISTSGATASTMYPPTCSCGFSPISALPAFVIARRIIASILALSSTIVCYIHCLPLALDQSLFFCLSLLCHFIIRSR